MRRAVGILPIMILALAACAPQGGGAPQTGENDAATASGEAPMSSPAATDEAAASGSVEPGDDEESFEAPTAVDDVLTDPQAFSDQPVTVSDNIEEVFVEDAAFLFSGTEVEGDVLVVLTPDATIEKDVRVDRVVTITGTVVPFTAEDLTRLGAGVGFDDEELAAFEGDVVIVATAVLDPLAQ